MSWRDVCVGACGGALLSLSRPPAGITLEEWMTPSGARQGVWRAGALTVIATALLFQNQRTEDGRLPAVALTSGAAIGFALHGFVLVDVIPIGSQAAWLIALAIGFCAMLALSGKSAVDSSLESVAGSSHLFRFGLAVCGAGAWKAFAAVQSRACLLGSGTRDDASVAGLVGIALVAVGTLASAPLLAPRPLSRSLLPAGLALTAVLTWFSFGFLHGLENPTVYDKLLGAFGMHSGLRGSFAYDALIEARVLALPALCAGTAIACSRNVSDFVCVLLGAAVPPIALASERAFDSPVQSFIADHSPERAAYGAAIAGLGALLAIAGARTGKRAWIVGSLVSFGCCMFGLFNRPNPALPLSPWERIAPRVEWIRETPEGLLTVEFEPKHGRVVTLDRRRLTPTSEEIASDDQRLRDSVRDRTSEVVIVGFITPQRAKVLRELGVSRVFVSTAWPNLEEEVERALFADAGTPQIELDFSRAWKDRVGSSRLGAIVAPPVEAGSRSLACLEQNDPEKPRIIGWLHARQDISGIDWGEHVVVSCAQIDDLSIGIQHGEPTVDTLPAGARVPSRAWQRLASIDLADREQSARLRVAERLFQAAHSPVTDALRRLCAAQKQSSPFETVAQRTELDPAALELLRDSALAREPRGFERELDELVASTLKGKRDLDGLDAFARPLADKYPSWVGLQRAAAAADWELMGWSGAARRLERIVEQAPSDLQARLWLVEALLRANSVPDALARAEALVLENPELPAAVKLRAIAALRAADPRGRGWLDEALRAHPGDPELAPYAQAGPLPPMWPSLGIPGEIPVPDHH